MVGNIDTDCYKVVVELTRLTRVYGSYRMLEVQFDGIKNTTTRGQFTENGTI